MQPELVPWIVFGVTVTVLLFTDLFLIHRRPHEIKLREALLGWLFWAGVAGAYNLFLLYWVGKEKAVLFLSGYLLEESLSIDNLFVILLLFNAFAIPHIYRHRVLFWGILGAVVMRAVFIFGGLTLIAKWEWILYIFGLVLIYSAYKLLTQKSDEEADPTNSKLFKLVSKVLPLKDKLDGEKFFIRENNKTYATRLFLVLILIEAADLVFAVDSIPAVFGVTRDPLIVYSSNIFAILGMRAIYFAIAGIVQYFAYFSYGLSLILLFIGAKLLLAKFIHLSPLVSLGVIVLCLGGSILASLVLPPPKDHEKKRASIQ